MSNLAVVVAELERHAAQAGWDQPSRLYALVPTDELLAAEPGLAETLADRRDGLTAIEQDPLPHDRSLEDVLASAEWPAAVAGVAAVAERVVLPPGADADLPEEPAAAAAYAQNHPDRQEVRIVAAATRSGETFCALRLRSHDEDASVVTGPDLIPGLVDLLHLTLSDVAPDSLSEKEDS